MHGRYKVQATQTARAAFRTAVFFLKVLPMLPSGFLNRITPAPVVEQLAYPTPTGHALGDLYRPSTGGPHPGMVFCLGVIPFDVEHPQVARLGEALARSGFAALLYWSPAMRDLRLDPEDIEGMALAYDALLAAPDIDPRRSGVFGTCVGGSFALMAAAHPLIRDRTSFAGAFAPFSNLWTFARDIASSSRDDFATRVAWEVDQLTRRVFVRTLTSVLDPAESRHLSVNALEKVVQLDADNLSAEARALLPLLSDVSSDEAVSALDALDDSAQERLRIMSPVSHLDEIHAPIITIGHDRDDQVIPVSESRQLVRALALRPGVHYTEFTMFQHADPTQKKLNPLRLLWEFTKLYRSVYPMFRQAVADPLVQSQQARSQLR